MSGHEEWTGAKPNRFRGGINTNVEQPSTREDAHAERKHFEKRPSDTEAERKACFKKVEQPPTTRPEYIKPQPPKPTEPKPRAERRHVPAYDSMMCEPEYPKVQNRVYTNTGTLVQYNPTSEYNDHQRFMGRKTRVATYEKKRNDLPVRSKGDKNYKKVEQSSAFYKGGGLIVGSTSIKRYPHQSKIGASDFATVISYEGLNPSRNKWSDTVKQWAKTEEEMDVKQLIAWERQTLKETIPGYREVSDSEEER